MKQILTIDPGASGGYCLRNASLHGVPLFLVPFISAEVTVHWLEAFLRGAPRENVITVIEAVHASPVMGPSAAFSFGENFGLWKGILASAHLQPYGVSPQQWQRELPLEGLVGSKRKSELNVIAKTRWPKARITLATCDAMLLSDYVIAHYLKNGTVPGKLLS